MPITTWKRNKENLILAQGIQSRRIHINCYVYKTYLTVSASESTTVLSAHWQATSCVHPQLGYRLITAVSQLHMYSPVVVIQLQTEAACGQCPQHKASSGRDWLETSPLIAGLVKTRAMAPHNTTAALTVLWRMYGCIYISFEAASNVITVYYTSTCVHNTDAKMWDVWTTQSTSLFTLHSYLVSSSTCLVTNIISMYVHIGKQNYVVKETETWYLYNFNLQGFQSQ